MIWLFVQKLGNVCPVNMTGEWSFWSVKSPYFYCLLTDRYFELEFTIKLFQTNDGHDQSKNYNDNGSKTYLKQSKITIKHKKRQKDSKQKIHTV